MTRVSEFILTGVASLKQSRHKIVMATFFSLLKDYRESIEKICTQYSLAMPTDNTPVVMDFSDDDPEVDEKITLFRLHLAFYQAYIAFLAIEIKLFFHLLQDHHH